MHARMPCASPPPLGYVQLCGRAAVISARLVVLPTCIQQHWACLRSCAQRMHESMLWSRQGMVDRGCMYACMVWYVNVHVTIGHWRGDMAGLWSLRLSAPWNTHMEHTALTARLVLCGGPCLWQDTCGQVSGGQRPPFMSSSIERSSSRASGAAAYREVAGQTGCSGPWAGSYC